MEETDDLKQIVDLHGMLDATFEENDTVYKAYIELLEVARDNSTVCADAVSADRAWQLFSLYPDVAYQPVFSNKWCVINGELRRSPGWVEVIGTFTKEPLEEKGLIYRPTKQPAVALVCALDRLLKNAQDTRHHAAANNFIQELRDCVADSSEMRGFVQDALVLEPINDRIDYCMAMLQLGVRPNKLECDGKPALAWCAANGRKKIVKIFLNDKRTNAAEGDTLCAALASKCIKTFKLLLKNPRQEVNRLNKDGKTVLMCACENLFNQKMNRDSADYLFYREVVSELLEQPELNTERTTNMTTLVLPLDLGVFDNGTSDRCTWQTSLLLFVTYTLCETVPGDAAVYRKFVNHGKTDILESYGGMTALHYACMLSGSIFFDIVIARLRSLPVPFLHRFKGNGKLPSPIMASLDMMGDNPAAMHKLGVLGGLGFSPDEGSWVQPVDTPDKTDVFLSPLEFAAQFDMPGQVQKMLETFPHWKNSLSYLKGKEDHVTPLALATAHDNPDTAELFALHGYDVNKAVTHPSDDEEVTALEVAMAEGSTYPAAAAERLKVAGEHKNNTIMIALILGMNDQFKAMARVGLFEEDSFDELKANKVHTAEYTKHLFSTLSWAVPFFSGTKTSTRKETEANALRFLKDATAGWKPKYHDWYSPAVRGAVHTIHLLQQRFAAQSTETEELPVLPKEIWQYVLNFVLRSWWVVPASHAATRSLDALTRGRPGVKDASPYGTFEWESNTDSDSDSD